MPAKKTTRETARQAEVQDNRRERQLASLLDLQRTGARVGDDATDEFGNPYELKTTTQNDIGTSRDVGPAYANRMRQRYLVAAKGRNTTYGFSADEIWLLHPHDLDEWIKAKLESRFEADEAIAETAIMAAQEDGTLTEDEVERLRYLVQRGMTFNNPKVSMNYIRAHGTLLDDDDPALQLREIVKARPITPPE